MGNRNYHAIISSQIPTLKKILPSDIKSKEAIFKEWLQVAKDKLQWKQIIKEYFKKFKTVEEEDPSSDNRENNTKSAEDENEYNYEDK